MKQYFLKGMDEPLQCGDTIEFDFMKKGDNNQTITRHIQCKFLPPLIPLLLDEDVLEVREVEDAPEGTIDEVELTLDEFTKKTAQFMDEAADAFQMFERRISAIEKKLKKGAPAHAQCSRHQFSTAYPSFREGLFSF